MPVEDRMRPFRLLLLTHYWPPEYGPDQAILHENLSYLQRHGVEVTVIAALPSYPTGIVPAEYRNRPLFVEDIGGIRTIRTWTHSGPRGKMKHRILNEVSFAASCILGLMYARRRFDLVLAVQPTQAITLPGWVSSKLVGARYGVYVMDLMPEAAVSLGLISNHALIAVLRALARFCYRRSSVVIAASEAFKRGVEAYGIAPNKVVCVPNGIDTALFRPVPADPGLRREFGLEGKYLAIYAGTHGYSHDLDTILTVAGRLQDEDDGSMAFVLVGGGSEKQRIVARANGMGLRNVHFKDPVERERLPALLAAADVDLVTFRSHEVNLGVIPIKMYDGMACARPIVLAISGEARGMLERAGAGIAIEPESPDALLQALRTLQFNPALAHAFGAAGRRYVEAHYTRERCAEALFRAIST